MTYKVKVTPKAIAYLESYTDYIANDSKVRAQNWLSEAVDLINSLETMPRRFPVIAESQALGEELRHIVHHSHRIIYRILLKRNSFCCKRCRKAYPTYTPQNHPQ